MARVFGTEISEYLPAAAAAAVAAVYLGAAYQYSSEARATPLPTRCRCCCGCLRRRRGCALRVPQSTGARKRNSSSRHFSLP